MVNGRNVVPNNRNIINNSLLTINLLNIFEGLIKYDCGQHFV